MLFTIIRDFFVQHVWGGTDSHFEVFNSFIGSLVNDTYEFDKGYLSQFYVPVGKNIVDAVGNKTNCYMAIGDWLSTTSTIITLVVILVCIAFFIRWIFKVCSNAILLR